MTRNILNCSMKIGVFSLIIFFTSCAKKQFHANTSLQEKANASIKANEHVYASAENAESSVSAQPDVELVNHEIAQISKALKSQKTQEASAVSKTEKLTLKEKMLTKIVEKQIKKVTKEDSIKDKSDSKRSNDLNKYLKLGLILILAGLLISLLPGLYGIGGVVIVIGVVLALIGLIQMFG